jgi:hypothetical protein
MHVLDGRFATRGFLLQRIIDFLFAPLVALEYSFCDFALTRIGHKHPSLVTRLSDLQVVWGIRKKRFEVRFLLPNLDSEFCMRDAKR